jgi:hypothetical protein
LTGGSKNLSASAEQQAYNDDAAAQYNNNYNMDNADFSAGDDFIKYWTDYAILPKRCIV